ncbi:hypothetical protein O1611_g10515 [Lasiodiplodia mahajangana]|uniref:Uncharacterized protein n=1 Tax=Lasiodiplodia mahajangana TaxID=1108764 RepID=A0ACC2IXC2_9PEZI|nr:hypothetical protein O1611_g10515 [Lasiodiplodia mahajangana]
MSKLGLLKSSKEPLRDWTHEPQDEDADIVIVNGVPNGYDEKEGIPGPYSKGKEKDPSQKRGKSKTRSDKTKPKDKDFPDRECIVQ